MIWASSSPADRRHGRASPLLRRGQSRRVGCGGARRRSRGESEEDEEVACEQGERGYRVSARGGFIWGRYFLLRERALPNPHAQHDTVLECICLRTFFSCQKQFLAGPLPTWHAQAGGPPLALGESNTKDQHNTPCNGV